MAGNSVNGVPLPMLDWDNREQAYAYSEWHSFLRSYFIINNIKEENKWHYILISSGTRGHKLMDSWNISDADKKVSANVFKKFEEHLVGTLNKWVMRLELAALYQKEGESVDDFICRLKAKASSCKFDEENHCSDQIVFQLIKGILWPEARKKLIEKGNDLKLDKAVEYAQSHEATLQNTSSFASKTNVDTVRVQRECKFCTYTHPHGKCPAYGKKCKKCGGDNHFGKSRMCRGAKPEQSGNKKKSGDRKGQHRTDTGKSQRKTVKNVNNVEVEDTEEVLDFDSVEISEVKDGTRQSIMAKLQVRPPNIARKATLTVKVDTGANGSILPMRCIKQMYPSREEQCKHLTPSSVKLTAVNGSNIEQMGYVDIPLCFDKSEWLNERFYVCETDGPAILSCDMSEKLGIVSVTDSKSISVVGSTNVPEHQEITNVDALKEMYPKCFQGIGKMPKEYQIELKNDAIPVISPPRKYPVQLKSEICSKIKEMEDIGVIEKVPDDCVSDWVSSLAFARKASGELRICLDPKNLNQAIKRTHHKVPTLEEMNHQFSGSTVFSKLDAKHGYWSIVLTDESSDLCTFNSPAGKYKFRRLPFGLKCSQDIFQKYMDEIIAESGDGVTGIADDIVVHGKSIIEHDKALHRLMRAAVRFGLVFRYEKCAIRQEEIKFYGWIWSKEGIRPDASKCDEIRNRKTPQNRTELQSFLGLVQYLGTFIPHLSSKTKVLRQLLRAGVEWDWNAEHKAAFEELKQTIHEDMKLRYFSPNDPFELEVDASLLGLGAALIQDGKPIAFASKALTPAESRYANIEREMLAVVFGLERFHTYIFGRSVLVHSDHKPLECINLKALSQAPPRLQRMLLRIQPYDATIKYRPGKDMVYADYLSRVNPTPGPKIELEQAIHMVQISQSQTEKLRSASKSDPELSVLSEQIVRGWPTSVKSVPKIIRGYWSMRDYLSVEDGLVFAGNRLVIPRSFRSEYLVRVHASHLGVTKSQLRAKESIYWPNMLSEIEDHIGDCVTCLKNAKSQTKEPMKCHELPSQPWEVLSTDLFDLNGHTYIAVVDHFSKMPFVRGLKSTTSSEVVKFFRDIFAIHGIPRRMYSDNGPQFASSGFKQFADEWEFEHITSSPRYPQSNGVIERVVGTVKAVLKKARESGTDPQLALLCLRSTPLDAKTPSPAELLYGRRIRSNLPAKNDVTTSIQDHRNWLDNKAEKSQKYYNQTAGPEMSALLPGMKVLVQDTEKSVWNPGTVKEVCQEPRSYVIETPNGGIVRRNRRFLKEIGTKATENLSFDNNLDDPPAPKVPDDTIPVELSSQPEPIRRSSRTAAKPKRYIEECSMLVESWV